MVSLWMNLRECTSESVCKHFRLSYAHQFFNKFPHSLRTKTKNAAFMITSVVQEVAQPPVQSAHTEEVETNNILSLNSPFPVIERPINCGVVLVLMLVVTTG